MEGGEWGNIHTLSLSFFHGCPLCRLWGWIQPFFVMGMLALERHTVMMSTYKAMLELRCYLLGGYLTTLNKYPDYFSVFKVSHWDAEYESLTTLNPKVNRRGIQQEDG